MNLPSPIAKIIANRPFAPNLAGMSGAQVRVFDDMVLKIRPVSEESRQEESIMNFLAGKLPVPRVLCAAQENGMDYLLMTRVPGKMACDESFARRPEFLVKILARALNMWAQTDITGCPGNVLLPRRLLQARSRVESGLCSLDDTEDGTYGENGFRSPGELLIWLENHMPDTEPVFSHGDFCPENLLLANDDIGGLIDFGRGGVADRWNDIALCWRSLKHMENDRQNNPDRPQINADSLFDELGIAPDWEKIRYYILLDELF